ncbi:D,D-heptose 1,7-bisphosphate phosphatase [Alicyclobacillus contaminans]|uniref:D-glycero-alpha-D-manno-heptose-1,7-bisphosphate 7-phosphatase n=1 Tax=Alicyclobacillus contaminans TaxID=392016 RepID=UPI0003F8368C|nr:HAD family hydrolase [Alicyclobacillus contaminans]GMA52300.1 D,D-heptose 1,7-bisphosphate phosphatase [Alicyclobacillus contaminans]
MKSAVILDRDGVINDHRHYVNSPADLYLFPFAGPAIRKLNDAGLEVYVATNQGGVGLGYLSIRTLDRIHRKLQQELRAAGAVVTDIEVCPHAPGTGCSCRKPEPGMLLSLQRKHGFTPALSYMVGDRESDVEAGQRAGMKTVRIGVPPSNAHAVVADLSEAVDWILQDLGTVHRPTSYAILEHPSDQAEENGSGDVNVDR